MAPLDQSQIPNLEMAHVLFMDIVAYSKLPMDEQQKVLRLLQESVRGTQEFARAQAKDELIRLPTGDGMALVFFTDPEAPVRCALELSHTLRDHPEIPLRMGIHSGPVYRVADINANRNVAGGGTNIAQRVMDCGDAGHILVSGAVAEVLRQLSVWPSLLHDLGEAEVKHGLRLHLYNLYNEEAGNPESPQKLRSAVTAASKVQSNSRRKKVSLRLVAAGVVAALALSGFFYSRRAQALTDKDTILLTDFVNTTGDAVFDGTLRQGLAVQLGQSPFLNLFPDARVRQTLRLMGRSLDERVTTEIGREICERQGLKALIAGTVAQLGSHYVITLEAVNGRSGESLAREQLEAESKEEVLKVLSRAATELREKLGESISSIQKFDAPLELTTSSLDALKAYTLGFEWSSKGKWLEAIPFYKRAVELDPNFAYAYSGLAVHYANTDQLGLAAESAEKAFALRARVSELEKLRISSFYYAFVTGEIDKGIEVLELYKQTYPRDSVAPTNLSVNYLLIGQFEKAVTEAREALRLNSRATGYANLGKAFIGLNRYAEAVTVFEQAFQKKLDTTHFRWGLYTIAFINGDAAAMQRQLDWAKGQPDEYEALDWQTGAAAFAGQWRRSQDFSRRSIDLAARSDAKEVAAQYAAEGALRGAVFGQCAQAKTSAAQSLALKRNQVSSTRSSLALALCGDAAHAQSLVDELTRRYPKDTRINGIWLPLIRAALELQHSSAAQAIELLQPATRYEAAAEFCPQYVRGLAYLKLSKAMEAAAEFQKILDHRGQAPLRRSIRSRISG